MVDFFYCSIVISRLSIAVSLAAKENKAKQNKKALYPPPETAALAEDQWAAAFRN